jgi:N-glycosidase YbiA
LLREKPLFILGETLMEERIYSYRNSIVFKKTKEEFGGLSNMAAGYPIIINGVKIRTSEALYQCCRFPHLPEIQRIIINEKSPMTAKMKSKPHRNKTREDWLDNRTLVMQWCLRVKLYQNWDKFSTLLKSTGDLPIVEESNRDAFWGAKPDGDYLKGVNCLGRLLMELRDELPYLEKQEKLILNPLNISDFLFFNEKIEPVTFIRKNIQLTHKLKNEPKQISIFESVNNINVKNNNEDSVIKIINEMLTGNKRASVEMVDYFIPEEIDRNYLLKMTNDIITKYKLNNNNNSYFLDILLDALLIEGLKTSTKSLFTTVLLKIVVTKEYKQKMINNFIRASLFTPNPLGAYLYTVVKKAVAPKFYLENYRRKIVTVARSTSFAALYGKDFNDDTFEEIIDAYQYKANKLVNEYQGKPIRFVVKDILGSTKINFPVNPFELCEKLKINIDYIDLPENLDGLTFKNSSSKRGLIILNKKFRGSKRENFTLSHELAHFYLHDFTDNSLISVNSGYLGSIKNKSKQEREANQFAELLLIPEGSTGEITLKYMEAPFLPKISILSTEWNISISVIISRLIKVSVYPLKLSVYKDGEEIYTRQSQYWVNEPSMEACKIEEASISNELTYKLIYLKN